jgi:hypothetical protein
LREIDDRSPGRNRHLGGWRNFGDALAFDDQHHVIAQVVTGGVEKVTGLDVDRGHGDRGCGGLGQGDGQRDGQRSENKK